MECVLFKKKSATLCRWDVQFLIAVLKKHRRHLKVRELCFHCLPDSGSCTVGRDHRVGAPRPSAFKSHLAGHTVETLASFIEHELHVRILFRFVHQRDIQTRARHGINVLTLPSAIGQQFRIACHRMDHATVHGNSFRKHVLVHADLAQGGDSTIGQCKIY